MPVEGGVGGRQVGEMLAAQREAPGDGERARGSAAEWEPREGRAQPAPKVGASLSTTPLSCFTVTREFVDPYPVDRKARKDLRQPGSTRPWRCRNPGNTSMRHSGLQLCKGWVFLPGS